MHKNHWRIKKEILLFTSFCISSNLYLVCSNKRIFMQFWANLIRENKLFPVWFNKFVHSMFESHRCRKFFSIPCYLRQRSSHLFQNCALSWKNSWKSTKSQRTETKKLKLIFHFPIFLCFFDRIKICIKFLCCIALENQETFVSLLISDVIKLKTKEGTKYLERKERKNQHVKKFQIC